MLIPLQAEPAEAFLTRASAAIADPNTHLYVDTSLAMWLTMVGPTSRAAFLDWSGTVEARLHVPAWTVQEYYRHHRAQTLKTDVSGQCVAVSKAAADFRSQLKLIADGPLVPGEPETAFLSRIDRVQDEVRTLSAAAKAWNYDAASSEVIAWINSHALDQSEIFSQFRRLRDTGGARYAHEVPPGYEDRGKGRNRYGDLLFWRDVVADARRKGAARVIVLTRDRKEDWYSPAPEPDVGPALRRLRSRWEPVPSPHPMLTFEMRTRGGCELILLDELYLGAVLWRADKVRYGRLAAVALGLEADRLSSELAPPASVRIRAAARQAEDRISAAKALALINGALEQPSDQAMLGILDALGGDAPAAERSADELTVGWVGVQDGAALASFARAIYDLAAPAQPFAIQAGRRLLDAVDQTDSEHASAVVGGMLTAAFYDNAGARHRPGGALLPDLYRWAVDPGCERVLKILASRLRLLQSAAIVLPDMISKPLKARLEAADAIATVPQTLQQVYFGRQAVLTDQVVGNETSLRSLLAGRPEATADEIVAALAQYYGVPTGPLETVGATEGGTWAVAETTGLERFGPLSQPERSGLQLAGNQGGADPQPDDPADEAEPTGDEDDDEGEDE